MHTTTAPKPMLAKPYEGQDITGWLMSEKLDGVRAIWDGEKLLSRNGNQFSAPQWFLDALPAGVTLDGELYIARTRFQQTVSVVKKKTPLDAEWSQIRFCVFDAPEIAGGFEQRLAQAAIILHANTIAQIVEHAVCLGLGHMENYYTNICEQGGEGIMLRAPGSAYEPRRSAALLKYKPFESDEAILQGTEQGEGRLTGIVGALIVKWKSITFRIGSGLTDDIRTNPPTKGARITFGYCGLTDSGTPRFPTFIAERCYE